MKKRKKESVDKLFLHKIEVGKIRIDQVEQGFLMEDSAQGVSHP